MPDRQPRPRRFGRHLAFASAQLTHWGDGVRKAISIVVAALLAVAIVSTIIVWTQGSSKKPPQVVRGVIGSEKKPFFGDPRVKAAFADHGYDVKSTPPAVAQIATTVDLSKSDFAFRAGTPEAQKILQRAIHDGQLHAVLHADGHRHIHRHRAAARAGRRRARPRRLVDARHEGLPRARRARTCAGATWREIPPYPRRSSCSSRRPTSRRRTRPRCTRRSPATWRTATRARQCRKRRQGGDQVSPLFLKQDMETSRRKRRSTTICRWERPDADGDDLRGAVRRTVLPRTTAASARTWC